MESRQWAGEAIRAAKKLGNLVRNFLIIKKKIKGYYSK